jgi:hypothetical protein
MLAGEVQHPEAWRNTQYSPISSSESSSSLNVVIEKSHGSIGNLIQTDGLIQTIQTSERPRCLRPRQHLSLWLKGTQMTCHTGGSLSTPRPMDRHQPSSPSSMSAVDKDMLTPICSEGWAVGGLKKLRLAGSSWRQSHNSSALAPGKSGEGAPQGCLSVVSPPKEPRCHLHSAPGIIRQPVFLCRLLYSGWLPLAFLTCRRSQHPPRLDRVSVHRQRTSGPWTCVRPECISDLAVEVSGSITHGVETGHISLPRRRPTPSLMGMSLLSY